MRRQTILERIGEGTKATSVTLLISVIEPPEWPETNSSFACFREALSVMLTLWEGQVSLCPYLIYSLEDQFRCSGTVNRRRVPRN
jgi:hypothetical protein